MIIRNLQISGHEFLALCRKWRINRISIFGSALRGEMKPESDIDLLVEFEPGEQWSLMDLVRAQDEFAQLFGRRVDLVERRNVERSSNWIRRNSILSTAEVIYVA